MSEPRVLPTEPGWWRCCHEYSASDEQIVHVIDEGGSLVFYGGLFNGFLPVSHPSVCWLAPVPSREAVDAAVIAMRSADSLAEWAGKHGLFNTSEFRELNRNAIAGLTGKGGV